MTLPRRFAGLILLLIFLTACLPVPAADPPAKRPTARLAVLVVFDQFRGDYLQRWDELLGEDGFHRLEQDGAWFQNCHYPYANTVTGAGHASLGTGTSPDKHGIIANNWFDRTEGEAVYCAAVPRYQRVPLADPAKDNADKPKKSKGGGSPDRLLSPTLADALKAATDGKGRVVSLSLKDRGAVLTAGKRPDACYWFDASDGLFVTSTYYRDRAHDWVEEFNKGRPADLWFGRDWRHLRPSLDYAKYSGPDDVTGEGLGVKKSQGRAFPHPMTGGQTKPGADYYETLYTSPFANDLLLDLAKRAIDELKLGTNDTPDLLCLSFSSNDPVGHIWGPDSQEVLDTTLRTDLVVKELLNHLDARVGKGRYILALSADHGVCPLPEVSREKGRDAKRLDPKLVREEAEAFLQEKFGKKDGRWIEATDGGSIYLNRATLKAAGAEQTRVEEALADWFIKRPEFQAAYTRTQLLKEIRKEDEISQRVRHSFHPERGGDVYPVLKPYYLMDIYLTGTTHGTPHAYDTHVPLLVYGPGVRPAVRREPIIPQAATVILASGLGIKAPADAEAPLPEKLFEE
jgi:predicted AlkP superfamily pyrophosphatase or phosphodiesterase